MLLNDNSNHGLIEAVVVAYCLERYNDMEFRRSTNVQTTDSRCVLFFRCTHTAYGMFR